MDLAKFSSNLKSINPWKLLFPILKKVLPEIADTNRVQLERGELSTGELMPEYKQEWYKEMKESLSTYKAPSGIPDLRVEGDFYDGLYADLDDNGIEFGSTDEKESKLEAMYTEFIFGIQVAEWEAIKKDKILPLWIEAIKREMFK